ncbi:MAG TPA: hypothetical protein VK530_16830, partial [Candidatus Acidoferrum sp.]|nr:hypothetical protein [Candidatus Acidoferrum sp.]
KISAPRAITREPLVVAFPESMDHALAQRVIRVANGSGALVDGKIALEDQERRWSFTPGENWRTGAHAVLVQTTIEDLAGNNIGKRFEVDLFEPVTRRFTNATARIAFEVR